MTISIFDTRTMMAAVEQLHTPSTFLLQTFFANSETFDTEAVDIDIYKGGRKLAPFVSPRLEGKVRTDQGYTTKTFKPAYIKEKMVTTAENIFKRAAGSHMYSDQTPTERAAARLGRELDDMNDEITRREEWMAAAALTTGKVLVKGDGVDAEVDFGMDASHKIATLTKAWTDQTANPLADIRQWARLVGKNSGRRPTHLVLEGAGQDALMGNKNFMEALNTRRIELGMIKPENLAENVVYLGYLNDPGVDIYVYNEQYFDEDTETLKPMIPAGQIIMGSANTRNARLYGAIRDVVAVESGLVEAGRYAKSWVTEDPSVRWVMLQSAPLPAMLEPDCFLTAQVL